MDAEIARLRDKIAAGWPLSKAEQIALLAAIEQAQKDVAKLKSQYNASIDYSAVYLAQRDQAQKDAKDARALLAEMLGMNGFPLPQGWRARIEAMLEQKP